MTCSPLPRRTSENGNIFFYILIGIVLFAALSYAVSRSSISAKNVSNEKAKLLASELIAQTNQVKNAISKIRLKGYNRNQISFENLIISGYTNAGCAVDDCKVFGTMTGLSWLQPPADVSGYRWIYTANIRIPIFQYSTESGSLTMATVVNSSKICQMLNNMLYGASLTAVIPYRSTLSWFSVLFTGTYATSAADVTVVNYINLPNPTPSSICVQIHSADATNFQGSAGTLTDQYYFLTVLNRSNT